MDYNTQRKKLIMPEYGRHVQKMVEYIVSLEDKEKRNEQIKTVLSVMGILSPALRDISDFKHKLWDNVAIISDFKLDVDSPYPVPVKETFTTKPNPIPLERTLVKAAHYGRNIQNMIDMIANKEDGEVKNAMVKVLANYMRQQYLIWNKDTVSEETIFNDIKRLSDGKLVVSEGIHLSSHNHHQQQRDQQRDQHHHHRNYKGQKYRGKGGKNRNK